MLRIAVAVLVAAGVLAPVPAVGGELQRLPRSAVSHRVETPSPRVGQRVVVTGRVRPAARRPVLLQRLVGKRWVRVATDRTDRRGRYRLGVTPSAAGLLRLRVRVPAARGRRATGSPVIRVRVGAVACRRGPGPVDAAADAAAVALVRTLDDWRCAGRTAVGQQVNISNDAWADLLDVAPARFRVVGFDLTELADALALGKAERLDRLVDLARAGHVLTASWHARNPWTGGDWNDRTDADLGALLTRRSGGDTAAYDAFWATWDQHLGTLAQLGAAGVPVVVRPLHEAGGGWFWWGHPDPAEYRALFARLQQRAAARGVHNLLWAYAAAPRTWSGVHDPVALVPARVDLGGTDSYDDTADGRPAVLDLSSYAAVAARVPRMALTEVGPQHSDGSWDPRVVADTLRRTRTPALWAMFWFDDAQGRKAVRSLQGGRAWLASCPGGLCPGVVG
ncbi:glycosyl hydrolase [Nocardioides lianchengensis]|uniref:Glycosyl hydrolase family 26 n=1 Tax=Nocardioides lianchengensis TaxID=1045774 RepID=A0A1G6M1W0_9ACTN|nr:glycosyl hydrolase [Nocardioides lianchengensis]NYG12376.1 hypothetical protein [Nocardioides lianchengensis]SDC49528.1 Glycosyl hydrolase family 26 [Nocardioides lianchengensis]